MKDANWLLPWMNEIRVHADGRALLELGCGHGADAKILSTHGISVVSLDRNSDALRSCLGVEGCHPVKADISSPLPFADNQFGFVLASLSLHYFSWQETLSVISEIQRVLLEGGMLLLRVNSTDDVNFGAGSGEEIESNYYLINGQKKRFFEKKDVDEMLSGMQINELWNETIDRYGKDKNVWVAQAIA